MPTLSRPQDGRQDRDSPTIPLYQLFAEKNGEFWRPEPIGQVGNLSYWRVMLSQLPEWVHFPQAADNPDHVLDDVIDLFLGVEAAQAETDAAVGQVVIDAEGAEDVTRLRVGRRAGRAGADGH